MPVENALNTNELEKVFFAVEDLFIHPTWYIYKLFYVIFHRDLKISSHRI
jgi:hypothetical protein